MNSSELGSAAEPAPILADVCVELESWVRPTYWLHAKYMNLIQFCTFLL